MLEIPIKVGVTKDQAQRAIEDFVNGARDNLNDIVGAGNFNIDVEVDFTATGGKEVTAQYSQIKTEASKYEAQLEKNSRTQKESITSLRQSVNSLKQQRDALNQTNPAWANYNKLVLEAQEKLRAASGIQKGSLTDLRRQREELTKLRDATARFPTGPGGKASGPTWNQLNKEIGELNRQINAATPGFSKFFSVLSKVATVQAGFTALTAGISSIGGLVNAYVGRIKQVEGFTLALKNVGLSSAEANGYLRESTQIATDLGAPVQQVEKGFKRMLPALRAVGTSAADSSKFITGLTARTQVLGLSTDESGRLFEAFAQVLSKGKLQAEELNQQISELDGSFRTQLADAVGVSTEALTELISEGAITAPVFVQAFLKMENGVDALQKRIKEGNATIQQLQNNISNISVKNLETIGRAIEPGIKSFLELTNQVVTFIREFLKTEQFKTITTVFNQVAKSLENITKGFLAALKVVIAITEPIFRVVNAVLGLGKEFGGLIGIVTTLLAALAGFRLMQTIGGWVDGLKQRFATLQTEATKTAAATERFQKVAGNTTLSNLTRQALVGSEVFKQLGQSIITAGANLLGFKTKAEGASRVTTGFDTAASDLASTAGNLSSTLGGSAQGVDGFNKAVGDGAKSTGSFSRSAQITAKYSLDFGRALGWTAGESARFLRTAKESGPVVYGLARGFAFGAGIVGKLQTAFGSLVTGLRSFGSVANSTNAQVGGLGRTAQLTAKYNLEFGRALGWSAGETAKFLRLAKEGGPVMSGLARAAGTGITAFQGFGRAVGAVKVGLSGLGSLAKGVGQNLALALSEIFNPATMAIMMIGNLIQIWQASGQAAKEVKALYAESLDTLRMGYEKATKKSTEYGKASSTSTKSTTKDLDKQNKATERSGWGWTAATVALGAAAVAAVVLTGGLAAAAAAGVAAAGGTAAAAAAAGAAAVASTQGMLLLGAGAAAAGGALLTTKQAVKELQTSARGKQWLESTKEFNVQLTKNNQAIKDLNISTGTLDFSKFAEGSTNLQRIGDALLANYAGTKQQISENEELIKSELAKVAPNKLLIEQARQQNAQLQDTLVKQKLLLDAYNAEIAARVRKGQAVNYESMSLEELIQLQDTSIKQVEKLREVQGLAIKGFSDLQGDLMGLGTSGVAAMVSTIDAIAERELDGLDKTDIRRKAIIQQQLEAQLKQNAFEERLGQLRLKLQNTIAVNEAKIQQARLEAEAKIAEAQGNVDLAQAYREAAQAQGSIIQGLNLQYKIESGVLSLQKEAKDQAVLTKGTQEGISQAVFDRYGVEKKGIDEVSGRMDGYIGEVENLAAGYGTAAENASDVATNLELEGIKNSVKPIEEMAKRLEDAKQELGKATTEAQKMAEYSTTASDNSKSLADNMGVAYKNTAATRGEMEKMKSLINSAPKVQGQRALGGPVQAGQQYTVNDGGGREGFVNKFGKFSMLPPGRNITWTAPSSGVVIPTPLVNAYKQNSVVNNDIKNVNQRSVTRNSVDPSALAAATSGNLSKRNGSSMAGASNTQRITNNITIQSQQPVMDASKIMANVSRMRARRRPF